MLVAYSANHTTKLLRNFLNDNLRRLANLQSTYNQSDKYRITRKKNMKKQLVSIILLYMHVGILGLGSDWDY
jgi:hypothetical protein